MLVWNEQQLASIYKSLAYYNQSAGTNYVYVHFFSSWFLCPRPHLGKERADANKDDHPLKSYVSYQSYTFQQKLEATVFAKIHGVHVVEQYFQIPALMLSTDWVKHNSKKTSL